MPQTALHKIPKGTAEGGADRHAEEHPGDAKEAAAHQDGHNDAKARKPRLFPQDLGADDIAVQLLQKEHENGKVQGFFGGGQQNEEGAGNGPQEGAEEGDHIGDADKDGDHRKRKRRK